MKNFFLKLLLLSFTLGCGPKKNDEDKNQSTQLRQAKFHVDIVWSEGPYGLTEGQFPEDVYSTAEIRILNADNTEPKSVDILEVEPWMKSMGHGTPVKPKVTRLGPNIFEISDIYFTMLGPWELNITAMVDGQKDTVEVKVEPLKRP